MLDPIVIAGSLALLVGCQLLYNLLLSPLRSIPGPWMGALTVFYMKYFTIKGRKAKKIHELHGKYGPVVRVAPDIVSISHLPSVREIYSVSMASKFPKSDWYQRFVGGEPNSFTMTSSVEHRQRRSLLAHGFTSTSLANMEPLIMSKVDMAVEKIKRDVTEKKIPTDVLKWFMMMATDVIGELAFGGCFHALETEEKTPYIRNLEKTISLSGIRAEFGIPAKILEFIGKLLPDSNLKSVFESGERTRAYGRKAIAEFASTRVKVGGSSSNENATILAKIFDAKDSETGATLSISDIENEATNLLVAGTDTTAITLTYSIWAIIRHPKIRRKLLDELATLPIDFGDAQLRKLPYLNAIINETLRLYGAAAGSLPRVVPFGGKEFAGYKIPGGTTVSAQPYTIHRDATVFSNPLKYEPERWLEPTPEMNQAFMPFGGGSRVCLGKHLAQTEVRLGLSHLFLRVPNLKLAPSCTEESMDIEEFFLIAPKAHKCEARTELVQERVVPVGANARSSHEDVASEQKYAVETADTCEMDIAADETKTQRYRLLNASAVDEEITDDWIIVSHFRGEEPIPFGLGRDSRNAGPSIPPANRTVTHPRLEIFAEKPGEFIHSRVPELEEMSGTTLSPYNPNWVRGYDRNYLGFGQKAEISWSTSRGRYEDSKREIRERWL
ncbi:hypothetical protein RUND412_005495 [Rhizina undulata]